MRIEVLIRLLDADDRVIEPSHFIPAAERYDLIAQIDRWVISTAIPLLAPLVERGDLHSISINLSGGALRDGSLARAFMQIVSRSRGMRSFNRLGGRGSSLRSWWISMIVDPRNGSSPQRS